MISFSVSEHKIASYLKIKKDDRLLVGSDFLDRSAARNVSQSSVQTRPDLQF